MILVLFAGGGGSTLGIHAAMPDADIVGIDNDRDSCLTHQAAGFPTIRADLATLPKEPFVGKVAGLWASPPCIDFSRAGKRAGVDGETGKLIYCAMDWARELAPEWIVFEQVPDVLPYWERFAERSVGYWTWTGILNSANFGVSQTRERAILLASRLHPVFPPEPTHAQYPHPSLFGPQLKPWVSMADALGWGMTERPGFTVATGHLDASGLGGSRARASMQRERERESLGRTVNTRHGNVPRFSADGPARAVSASAARGSWVRERVLMTNRGQDRQGNRQEVPADRPAPSVTGKAASQWKVVDEPAPTIPASADNGDTKWVYERPSTTVMGDSRIFPPDGHHPEMGMGNSTSRAIKVTLAELARLQDFPDDWPFQGTKTSVARQIGNAVPSSLAEVCVRAVM